MTTHQHPPIGASLNTAEIKALPNYSIVVDPDGDAMQKRTPAGEPSRPAAWVTAGVELDRCTFDDFELEGSILLYIPEIKEQDA